MHAHLAFLDIIWIPIQLVNLVPQDVLNVPMVQHVHHTLLLEQTSFWILPPQIQFNILMFVILDVLSVQIISPVIASAAVQVMLLPSTPKTESQNVSHVLVLALLAVLQMPVYVIHVSTQQFTTQVTILVPHVLQAQTV